MARLSWEALPPARTEMGKEAGSLVLQRRGRLPDPPHQSNQAHFSSLSDVEKERLKMELGKAWERIYIDKAGTERAWIVLKL